MDPGIVLLFVLILGMLFVGRGVVAGKAVRGTVRFTWWATKLPFRSLKATLVGIVALASEELKRWIGILTGGLFLALLTWLALQWLDFLPWVQISIVLVDLMWVVFGLLAARATVHNRVEKVRARKAYQALHAKVDDLPNLMRAAQAGVVSYAGKGARMGSFKAGDTQTRTRTEKEDEAAEDFVPSSGRRWVPVEPAKQYAKGWGQGFSQGWGPIKKRRPYLDSEGRWHSPDGKFLSNKAAKAWQQRGFRRKWKRGQG